MGGNSETHHVECQPEAGRFFCQVQRSLAVIHSRRLTVVRKVIVKVNENRQHIKDEQNLNPDLPEASWNMLSLDQIKLIDTALSDLGPFGEVRLIKAKGKLRFIQVVTSRTAL